MYGLRLQKAEAAAAGWLQLAGCNCLAALVYVDAGQATHSIYCEHAARREPHMHSAQDLRQDK